ncbi:MAG: hypothetical protein E6R03_01815 [Hyphomicrobiaceae bacterium]|nr:MAG: hypothetical protein E6R03_01815 [Hyphomicrobiaceae bacterium]
MTPRQRQARASRSTAMSREIDIPLPTRGLFVDASTSDVSGLYAAVLHNFRSNGLKLETRRQATLGPVDQVAVQRIPFEFGLSPRYVDLRATQAECAGQTFTRAFDGNAMAAYISSQVVIADGLDDPLLYNGTAFQLAVFTVTTGASPDAFDGVIAHHDRLYFWKTNGVLEFYYGDVGAVSGPLTRFPLDRLGNITGGIQSMMSLTMNAGVDTNDALAIITTTGDVVIYEGLDPGDSTLWQLSTRLKVAPPVSRFGMTRVGGDVWMMTTKGVVSMQETIARGVLSLVNEVSRPISEEILDLVAEGPAEWQLHTAADGSQIIINYFSATRQRQFIWHTDSRAWSTAGIDARRLHNLVLSTDFTSGAGRLGSLIRTKTGSEQIAMVWWSSWFKLGRHGHVAAIIPKIIAAGPLSVTAAVLSNRNATLSDIAEASQTVTVSPENPADPGSLITLNDLIPVGAVGSEFQLRLEITATWAEIVEMKALVA